jgi:hypothetical protein
MGLQSTSGIPLAGALMFTYQAGTTSKQNSFTDSTGSTPLPNPIVLNVRGDVSASLTGTSCGLWIDPTLVYKIVLAPAGDTDPPGSPIWTLDQIVTANYSVLASLSAFEAAVTGVPIGAQIPYAGSSAPAGWLLCYGQAVSRTTYASLLAAYTSAQTGSLSSGSPTITGVTSIPTNLVAGTTAAYTVGSGSILTDLQGLLPPNTTVIGFNAGAQTITMSANANGSSVGVDNFTYTVPGDFPIPRPLRITSGFTRFNTLDYPFEVKATEEEYNSILYKLQPGPWPVLAWANNQFPYLLLNVYQVPGNGAECHLFTDTVLSNLTLASVISMPQGYNRALKWLLAMELAPEYGFEPGPTFMKNVGEARAFMKALNAQPAKVATYDRALKRGNRGDAGFIIHGGYGR